MCNNKIFSIIVARYNENVEWIKNFADVKVIIYNKGEEMIETIDDNNIEKIKLDNVGRECHTFYTHIYNNYDTLEDYLIFLQGNPFDHSPNVIKNVNKYLENKELDIEFEFISETIIKCNLYGCIHHPGLPIRDTYQKLFDDNIDNLDIVFGQGGQFIVSKKQILKKPKSFYKTIVELLSYAIDPIEGYVFERSHKLIFE